MLRLLFLMALLFTTNTFSLRSQETELGSAIEATTALPMANQKMVEFAQLKKGKKVGHGICADFVRAAMDYSVGRPVWFTDREVNRFKEPVLPGDILYISWKRGRRSHVAIITKVISKSLVEVANQNFNGIKYVVKSTFDLSQNHKQKREVTIYRPQGQKK